MNPDPDPNSISLLNPDPDCMDPLQFPSFIHIQSAWIRFHFPTVSGSRSHGSASISRLYPDPDRMDPLNFPPVSGSRSHVPYPLNFHSCIRIQSAWIRFNFLPVSGSHGSVSPSISLLDPDRMDHLQFPPDSAFGMIIRIQCGEIKKCMEIVKICIFIKIPVQV